MGGESVDAILQAKATISAAWLTLYGSIGVGLGTVLLSGIGAYLAARHGAKIGATATIEATKIAQQRAEEAAERAQQRAIEIQLEEWARLQKEQDKSTANALLYELATNSTLAGQPEKHLHKGYSWILLERSALDYALLNLRITPIPIGLIEGLIHTKAAILAYNSQAD